MSELVQTAAAPVAAAPININSPNNPAPANSAPVTSPSPQETKIGTAVLSTQQSATESKGSGSTTPFADLVKHVKSVLSPTKLFSMAKDALAPVATGIISDLISGGTPILQQIASDGINSVVSLLGDLLICKKFFNDPDIAMAVAHQLALLMTTDGPIQFKNVNARLEFYRLMLSNPPQYKVEGKDREYYYDERMVFTCNVWNGNFPVHGTIGGVAGGYAVTQAQLPGVRAVNVTPDSTDVRFDWAPWVRKAVLDYKLVQDPGALVLQARGGIDEFDMQVVLKLISSTGGWDDGFRFSSVARLIRLMQYACMWFWIPGCDGSMICDRYHPYPQTNGAGSDLQQVNQIGYFPYTINDATAAHFAFGAAAIDMVLYTDIIAGIVDIGALTNGVITRQSFGVKTAVVPVNRDIMSDPNAVTMHALSYLEGPIAVPVYTVNVADDTANNLVYGNNSFMHPRMGSLATPGVSSVLNGLVHQFTILFVVIDYADRGQGLLFNNFYSGSYGGASVPVPIHTRTTANTLPNTFAGLADITANMLAMTGYQNRFLAEKCIKDWFRWVNNQQDWLDALHALAGTTVHATFKNYSGTGGDAGASAIQIPYESTQAAIANDAYVVRPGDWTNADYNQVTDAAYYTAAVAPLVYNNASYTFSGFGTMPEDMTINAGVPNVPVNGSTLSIVNGAAELEPFLYNNMLMTKVGLDSKKAWAEPPMLTAYIYEIGKSMHYIYHAFMRAQRLNKLEYCPPPNGMFGANLSYSQLVSKHQSQVLGKLRHLMHVACLTTVRVNYAVNTMRNHSYMNWGSAAQAGNPHYSLNYQDPGILPLCLYETKMGRAKTDYNTTTMEGVANYFYGTRYPNNAVVRYVGIDRKSVDKNIIEWYALTDQAFYKNQNSPGVRSFQVKLYNQDQARDLPRSFMNYGWMKVLWVLQTVAGVVPGVRPNYTWMDVFLATPSADYTNLDQPVRILYQGLYSPLGLFLANAKLSAGLRLIYGRRGDVTLQTAGLAAPQNDPDQDRLENSDNNA